MYKIDDSLIYICRPNHPKYSCPPTHECLNNYAPELIEKGSFIADKVKGELSFVNIYTTTVYMLTLQSFDSWSQVLNLLVSSGIGNTMLIIIFIMGVFVSLVMKGIIVANYCSNISKAKNRDIFLKEHLKALQELGRPLASFIEAVDSLNHKNLLSKLTLRPTRGLFAVRAFLRDLFRPVEIVNLA